MKGKEYSRAETGEVHVLYIQMGRGVGYCITIEHTFT